MNLDFNIMRRRFYQNNTKIDYFTINAVEDTTFSYTNRLLGCFIDEDEWFDIDMNESIFIEGGRGIKIKSKNTTTIQTFGRFSISGLCDITGEILSITPGYTKDGLCPHLSYLFSGCTGIRDINESFLPFTNLIEGCYAGMFHSCSSLTTAPQLPATKLAKRCYEHMFHGCSSLTRAPELPATTLTESCYNCMFQGCTSLTTAPELLATTLVDGCYIQMFYGCISLNYIKAMFITSPYTTSSDDYFGAHYIYTDEWVYGVASSGTFVKNKNAAWVGSPRVDAIPEGWDVIKI